MEVNIYYRRLSARGTTTFREALVAEDGQRLTTHSVLHPEDQLSLSRGFWRQHMLPDGATVGSVRNHYFYHEHFHILAVYLESGELGGYYCDITTPLRKIGDDYYLDDLFLDYWLRPGQPPMALDEDEFDAAVAAGMMTTEQIGQARATFARLGQEIAAGIFPQRYIEI